MVCGVCESHDISLKRGTRGWYYECNVCHARTGCYPNTRKPRGRTANNRMRKLRGECHAIFDMYWTNGLERARCYQKLARQLGIPKKRCHFSMMSYEELKRAYAILTSWPMHLAKRGY